MMTVWRNATVRRWLVPGTLTMVFLGTAAALWLSRGRAVPSAAARGAPALQVDGELVDLGPVPLGQWVEVAFRLANSGADTLRIDRSWVEVVEGC
jgi:hypothetical protein